MKKFLVFLIAFLALMFPAIALDEAEHLTAKQDSYYVGSSGDADPIGDLIFMDSVSGNDGDPGYDQRHAVKTLSRALAIAGQGDTIILDRGGSETITAALTVATTDIAIVCPTVEGRRGFTLTGGNHHLLNINADGVRIEGMQFANSTMTATKAQIYATNSDDLVVRDCVFNASAQETMSIVGVGLYQNCKRPVVDSCEFLDPGFGVLITGDSSLTCINPLIKNSKFMVGKDSSFGVNVTSTQKVTGLQITDCDFIEADGKGDAAHASWNGTTGADATRGPIKLAATVDQFLIDGCYGSTASSYGFATTCYVTSGAVGDIVECSNGETH